MFRRRGSCTAAVNYYFCLGLFFGVRGDGCGCGCGQVAGRTACGTCTPLLHALVYMRRRETISVPDLWRGCNFRFKKKLMDEMCL
ncbi:hypothetical protein BKA66DRAFT_233995 [Pyrenochaeta sp. MPI-SDFR-AT-0127]|nr:hypothetical protein BKA66DRAFT_233995 [Pyrenochaeta sp. MPI-SDFR-AT-0127]